MTALIVVLCILLLFLLIGQVRVGGMAEYSAEGVTARVRVGPLWFTVCPVQKREKPEKKRAKKEKKKKKDKREGPQEEEPKKKGGPLKLIIKLLPPAMDIAGRLLRKIRIDLLTLRLTWAAEDAAAAAMGYGAANAAVGAILPLLERGFSIKKREIDIAVDFTQTEPVIYIGAALTLTIGQIFTLALRFGVQAIRVWAGQGRRDPKASPTNHEERGGNT